MTKNGKDYMFNIVVRIATALVFCLYMKHMTNELALSSLEYYQGT